MAASSWVTTGQALVRTGHVANGALLLASTVVLALRSSRHLSPMTTTAPAPRADSDPAEPASLEMIA